MIRIRDATTDDLNAFLVLGEKMLAESIEPYPPIEREHARKYLDMAISMPGFALMALAEDDGEPIGMVTAVAGPYCFSPRLRSASDLLFVLPERRGGMAAARLVRRFSEWSDALEASATLTIATGIAPERTGRFFELMGFRLMGMMYQRNYG